MDDDFLSIVMFEDFRNAMYESCWYAVNVEGYTPKSWNFFIAEKW